MKINRVTAEVEGLVTQTGVRQTRAEDERRGVSELSAGGELHRSALCPAVTL